MWEHQAGPFHLMQGEWEGLGARVQRQLNISPPPPTSLCIQAAVGHQGLHPLKCTVPSWRARLSGPQAPVPHSLEAQPAKPSTLKVTEYKQQANRRCLTLPPLFVNRIHWPLRCRFGGSPRSSVPFQRASLACCSCHNPATS